MKKYNLLAFTSLLLIGASCNADKKKLFSFDESKFKLSYHQNDNVSLTIVNKKDMTIDSITFFNGDKKIGSVKGDHQFNYNLNEQKLGYQNLKAVVYFNGDSTKIESRIELVSHIEPKLLSYTILNTFPHDIKAYTQGLEFFNDFLLEGTGNGAGNGTGEKGISSLRKTDYKTGKVLKKVELGADYFGEGITVLNNKVYQLTWLNNEGYVYNVETFKKEKTFKYFKKMEGWGLTNDGKNLYQSDGTERITILNPQTFQPVDYINVYTAQNKIKAVNELEWIDGKIYANIYQMDAIAIIDPKSGAVEGVVDLSALKKKVTQHPDIDVLNGIAYNPKTKTIFVTGKNWDKMFEIRINP